MRASRMPRAGNFKDRAETVRAASPHPPIAFWACCQLILRISFEVRFKFEYETTLVPYTNRVSSRVVPPLRGSFVQNGMDEGRLFHAAWSIRSST
jgi:hypothetical protein